MSHHHYEYLLSPLDIRYAEKDLLAYLSEEAIMRYRIRVEEALVSALARRGLCPLTAPDEVRAAGVALTLDEVRQEEERVNHDIRALVNCLRNRVSVGVRPYVHLTATSADIVDTARVLSYRDALLKVLLPDAKKLLSILIGIARREADTIQIGRTHGQHAVPITFGFTIAGYVSRLGLSIEHLEKAVYELPGMCSGAVGALNAASLIVDDPRALQREILAELDLVPAEHSTQIMPPEPFIRLFSEITTMVGVLGNIADDMRHLQRTEIGEVGEAFGEHQVGSSTMPHKRNPISFEQIKSFWKIVVPRLTTVFMDQISEHQRDLTGSASTRTHSEIIAYAVAAVRRMSRAMKKLSVDQVRLAENFERERDVISAEPLYIILSVLGHPDAHEKVRVLSMRACEERVSLYDMMNCDAELAPYRERMTARQREMLQNHLKYNGYAPDITRDIVARWEKKI